MLMFVSFNPPELSFYSIAGTRGWVKTLDRHLKQEVECEKGFFFLTRGYRYEQLGAYVEKSGHVFF